MILPTDSIKRFLNTNPPKPNSEWMFFSLTVSVISLILSMIFGEHRVVIIPLFSAVILASIFIYCRYKTIVYTNRFLFSLMSAIYLIESHFCLVYFSYVCGYVLGLDMTWLIGFEIFAFIITVLFSVLLMIFSVRNSKNAKLQKYSASTVVFIVVSVRLVLNRRTFEVKESYVTLILACLSLVFVLLSTSMFFRAYLYKRVENN